jgi:hypothetical protein
MNVPLQLARQDARPFAAILVCQLSRSGVPPFPFVVQPSSAFALPPSQPPMQLHDHALAVPLSSMLLASRTELDEHSFCEHFEHLHCCDAWQLCLLHFEGGEPLLWLDGNRRRTIVPALLTRDQFVLQS